MKKLFIIIILLFSTSCIKYTELNDLSIVKSIGITYSNNSYSLYVEIYEEIKKNNEPKTKIINTSANTINELFNNIKLMSNKEIYLSHIDLLILDEKLNNKNYQEIINYFINNNFRNDFYCIITKDVKRLLTNSKYDEIETFLKANNESKNIINSFFDDIINSYLNNNSFFISMINYNNDLVYDGNYFYSNNNLERISNEKNRT